MIKLETVPRFTRRSALKMGAGLAGSLAVSTSLVGTAALADDGGGNDDRSTAPSPDVQHQIEHIIQAKGAIANGVLSINIDRNDISGVTLHGTPILVPFQINGTLVFQSDGRGGVVMNSDMALKATELQGFIEQLIAHNIYFQAEHQHFYNFDPLVWFIHFRAAGDPSSVANGVKAALNVTSTPFPQTPPTNPTTPLPAQQIGEILGASPTIGSDGVVSYLVPRAEPIRLGGVLVNPYLNVAAPIAFQPLSGGLAAAVPDFAMIASEINPVVGLMRKLGWEIGCLYNQETAEYPQLYFSHQFKTGDPIQLAQEIRRGLDLTRSKFKY